VIYVKLFGYRVDILYIGLIGLILAIWIIGGFHFRHTPTADELYGCTPAQQAPNGECK